MADQVNFLPSVAGSVYVGYEMKVIWEMSIKCSETINK
jgi:hypothetical protein